MGYFRSLIVSGSFLVVFGHMMLSLCTVYWQVLLAQAFCIGIGMGLLFIPSVAILSTYFTTHLALATGIAASGSSLGGVLYPIILHRLLPQVGYPWAVRSIGFIALATLLLPNFCMKVRVLPATRRKMIDTTAFKSLPFMLFCFGVLITFIGLYQPFFFIQTFAIQKHITTTDFGFYLLSILNATSIFGRIVPNYVADKIGAMNIIGPCAIMSGVLIFCLVSVHNLGGIVIIALLFGFFSGKSTSPNITPTLTIYRLTGFLASNRHCWSNSRPALHWNKTRNVIHICRHRNSNWRTSGWRAAPREGIHVNLDIRRCFGRVWRCNSGNGTHST
jgi:MFS family permease